MATTKVSALTETTSPQANDELLINQSGVSKKVKITNLPAGLDTTKLPLAGGQMTGNITMAGSQTVDGRDVSADGTQLDTNTSAIATKAPIASPTFTGTVAIPNIANLETTVAANTAKVTNATHTGDVTGATALTIANDAVTVDKLNLISTGSVPSLEAKGTSGVTDGYIQLNCAENSHGIKLKSPPHSAGASYTLTFPNDDGTANQKLTTNGSGVLTWTDDNATDATKLPLAGGAMTGAITTNSTFDGVDVGARDAVLTSTTTTANAALPKAGGTMTGNLDLGDNNKLLIGTGNDLEIYHDGHSRIVDTGTGNLVLAASTYVKIDGVNGENMAEFAENGAVKLFNDNTVRLETTSYGAYVVNELRTGSAIQVGAIGDAATNTITVQSSDKSYFQAKTQNDNENGALMFGNASNAYDGRVEYVERNMKLYTATVERMQINSAGNVGIGTQSPGSYNSSTNNLVIRDTSNAGITISTGASNTGYYAFNNGEDTTIEALIAYNHSNNTMSFRTNTVDDRIVINSSGKVGIGDTAPEAEFSVVTGGNNSSGHTTGIEVRHNGYSGYKSGMSAGDTSARTHTSGFIGFLGASHSGAGERHITFETRPGTSDIACTERMRIKSNGYIGINDTAPQARLNTAETGSNWVAIFDKNNTGNSTNFLIRSGASNRGAESMLHIEGNHPDCGGTSTDAEFIVYGDGDVRCDGSYASGGADYAEYFESSTGAALTYGNTVKLNAQGKVVQCGAEETPIGVIRPDSATGVIGNNPMNWNKKYLRDGFGVLILDEDGNDQVNPDFNPDLEYVMREDRPEWNAVGLMGQVPIIKGQPTASNWIKMWEINSTLEMWFIK